MLKNRCAKTHLARRRRYGASTEFGRSICIETEFNHDWCACLAVMHLMHNRLRSTACSQASVPLECAVRARCNAWLTSANLSFAWHARRPAFYNYTSAVLSDARGARSFESCNCKREVRLEVLITMWSWGARQDWLPHHVDHACMMQDCQRRRTACIWAGAQDYTELRELSVHSYMVPGSSIAGQLSLHLELVTRDYAKPQPIARAIQVRGLPVVISCGGAHHSSSRRSGNNSHSNRGDLRSLLPQTLRLLGAVMRKRCAFDDKLWDHLFRTSADSQHRWTEEPSSSMWDSGTMAAASTF